MYIDDIGPWNDCGADSILNASTIMSWVELKNAKKVMNKAIKNKLFWGFVKEIKNKNNIIKIWDNKSQLLLRPNFFKKGEKVFLEAANPAYEPIELSLDQVVFQGKLLAVWRKI